MLICDPQLKLGFSVAQFKSWLLLTCYYWLYCWFLVEPMSQGDMVWTCWNVSTVLPGRRRPLLRPHLTSVTAAALAASPSASHVQDRGAGVSVTYWSGCHVPRWQLSSSVRRWSSPTAIQLQWRAEAALASNI